MSNDEEACLGVLVVGTCGDQLERVAEWIGALCGAATLVSAPDRFGLPLGEMNELLLTKAGGCWTTPPRSSPRGLERDLLPHRERARAVLERCLGGNPQIAQRHVGAGWVWADPRLALLAPFWTGVLSAPPLVVWSFQEAPTAIAEMTKRLRITPEVAESLWDRYHRSALSAVSDLDVLMLSQDTLFARPETAFTRAAAFFRRHGVEVANQPWKAAAGEDGRTVPNGKASPREVSSSPASDEPASSGSGGPEGPHAGRDAALYNLLARFEQDGFDAVDSAIDATAAFYDEEYYRNDVGDASAPVYSRDEPHWQQFFRRIASEIVTVLRPETAMDVGCAIGMLVEALRDHGVDAYGIDVSPWAIKQVPDDVRPFCSVGSILSPLPERYDVITCIEVLEHLPPTLAPLAIANLCANADTVLMSSTADDVTERSHLNVNPLDYWARLFAEHGFVRDFAYDATYISPDAVLFRKRQLTIPDAIGGYEALLCKASVTVARQSEELQAMLASRDTVEAQRQAACNDHDRLADRFNALAVEHQQLLERTAGLELRRNAEAQLAGREIELLERSQSGLAADVEEQRARAEAASAELAALQATKVIRYSRRFRRLYGRLRALPRRRDQVGAPPIGGTDVGCFDGTYLEWVARYDQFAEEERAALLARLATLADPPLVSIVLPVYNTPEPLLRRAIESVRAQVYPRWELCAADDKSTETTVAAVLAEFAAIDERIKVVHRQENGHISASSNSALDIARGEWIVAMDHDDELRPHALAHLVLALAEHPEAGMVYSDEDKIDVDGQRHSPNFKPDFDPLLLLGQNYLGHLVCYRRDLIDRVGGYREGFEGSQDWDLSLRISELLDPEQVVHIPRVLYHWRAHTGSTASGISAKPYARLAGRNAVEEHLSRMGAPATVITNPLSGWHRVRWELPAHAPKVSIIVPTRDGQFLWRCLSSVFQLTAYPNFDVLVVDNGSKGRPALDLLRGYEQLVKLIRDERPFNYSGLNNYAVDRSDGDIICLLNDDCEVTTTEWLDEMVGQLLQEGVGAVGSKLLYPDGRIQHAGVVLGFDGVAGHADRLQDRLAPGHGGRLQVAHAVSAVTGACMAIRREAWQQVGGLDEHNLPVAFNDVDFCLRLHEAGWRIVWTPFAEMLHHESLTRGADTGPRADGFARECAYMKERWGPLLRNDPTYNPNLTLWSGGGDLASPPRVDRT
jgi:GT2 family glycosyltransferase